ncbi:MAG: PilZ domain-containing protein [bacterium]|nr:PilZ domain-containing protein [bacterium]MDT8395590.1 PilZ domain-containing protein [bacterium]
MDDKRRHSRYPAAEMTYVVGLQSPALITDVSQGGLGVRYKGTDELPGELVVDLLNASQSIQLEKVRCRKVRDETVGRVAVFSYVTERRLGLEFVEPGNDILDALARFVGKEN